jgi:uncharacterized damage-inducible protein DinB
MSANLIETWHINNRINLYLLNALEEAHLNDTLATKGRTVGEQFAHIHNVRLMWIKVSSPEMMKDLSKIEKEDARSKSLLEKQLTLSSDAIGTMLEEGLSIGRIKGFKPHPEGFLGYMIAHDSHHRSQIILALKNCGNSPTQKVSYGIWEWGVR